MHKSSLPLHSEHPPQDVFHAHLTLHGLFLGAHHDLHPVFAVTAAGPAAVVAGPAVVESVHVETQKGKKWNCQLFETKQVV